MRTMKKMALVMIVLSAIAAFGQGGTFTSPPLQMLWNGNTRSYDVYVPVGGNPTKMVLYLHPTTTNSGSPLPIPGPSDEVAAWELLADSKNFLVVWPASTYNSAHTRPGKWYWDAEGLDFSFPTPPDDFGFLKQLVMNLQIQYHMGRNQTYVSGFSSGCFMAQGLAISASGYVSAVACVAGRQEASEVDPPFTMPMPVMPVRVLIIQGDADNVVPYCGLTPASRWGVAVSLPSIDSDAMYWKNANRCTDSVQALCGSNGMPNAALGLDYVSCTSGGEVKVKRECGRTHMWVPRTDDLAAWNFFNSSADEIPGCTLE
jgi:poly(3-hydroxybutyrate) depolymerase